jgi:hypothetical protein
MFINWIDVYSESHFAVIRKVYKNPGTTRQEIWGAIHGAAVGENSAEADLFKLLIHDLKYWASNQATSASRLLRKLLQGSTQKAKPDREPSYSFRL